MAEAQSALALAVDLGNIAVWRHDLATQRMHYNAQAYRVLDIHPRPEGLSIEEVREFIHPDDLPRVLASAQRALQVPGPTDMEARYRRADGSWRQVMTRRVLQRNALGRPQAFIGVAMDVTAQHEEQRQAAETKRRFALATEAAGIGYWMAERNAAPTWNAPMRAMFALAPDEPTPSLHEWVSRCVHPDDRAEVQQHFEAWLRSREPSHDLTLRALRPRWQRAPPGHAHAHRARHRPAGDVRHRHRPHRAPQRRAGPARAERAWPWRRAAPASVPGSSIWTPAWPPGTARCGGCAAAARGRAP